MGIEFGSLIQRSFEIAWKYKSLWIFGMFAGGTGSFNFDWTKKVEYSGTDMNFTYDWFEKLGLPTDLVQPSWAIIGAIVLWVAALLLLFFICHLIAQPAIIDAVNKITRGGQYVWGTSFSRGTDFLWRYFGLLMVELFASVAIIGGVVVLAIVLTPFSLLLTIPVALVLFFFVYHTFRLAAVALVARDSAIADSIIEGWNLLLQNKTNCFLITLIMIGLGIAFLICMGIVTFILYWPINALVLSLTGNLVAILFMALFIGMPVAFVVGGYMGSFFNALYVQFYFRLVEPPQMVAVPATV